MTETSPLIIAIQEYNIEILQVLLDSGLYNVNELDTAVNKFGQTPLMFACYFSDWSSNLVEQLLKHGADVNVKNLQNSTALQWCAYYGRPKLMELLLKQPGIKVNTVDNNLDTPLKDAIDQHNKICVELLKAAGAKE